MIFFKYVLNKPSSTIWKMLKIDLAYLMKKKLTCDLSYIRVKEKNKSRTKKKKINLF